jgi:S-adenosylmethionine uptake transporter
MSSKKKPISNGLLGIIFMIIHAAAMSAVYITGKQLGKVISGDQIAFLYKFGVLICTIPLVLKDGVKKVLKTEKIKLHILRAIFSLLATICFYRGLLRVPALDATAITFIEPIIALLVGVIYFKESISTVKIFLVSLCFTGVLFVFKPGFDFNRYYFFLIGALIFWAMNNLSIKILGKTEKTITTLFYVSLFTTIFAFPIAMRHSWSGFQIGYMKHVVIMTICHMIHMVCFFRALKLAEMSSVMPFDYTRLFFTGILAYTFLDETPDNYSIIGYILIATSGMMLIFYETKRRKNKYVQVLEKNLQSEV